jgi:hypothetical protein
VLVPLEPAAEGACNSLWGVREVAGDQRVDAREGGPDRLPEQHVVRPQVSEGVLELVLSVKYPEDERLTARGIRGVLKLEVEDRHDD